MWSRSWKKKSPFQIRYNSEDCFYEVVSPLELIVARFVKLKQAIEFVEQVLKGVVEDEPEETDTVS
jgi:hypothetical protein